MSIASDDDILLGLGLSSGSTTEEASIVTAARRRAEGAVKRYLHYDPEQKTRTEYYPRSDVRNPGGSRYYEVTGGQAVLQRADTRNATKIVLKHIPIRSITSLYEDSDGRFGKSGAFGSETEKTEGTDFWVTWDEETSDGDKICRDGILHASGSWSTVEGSIKVTYVAGYTAAEFQGTATLVDASPIWEVVVDEAETRAKSKLLNKKQSWGWAAGPITSERLGDYNYKTVDSMAQRLFGNNWELQPGSKQKLSSFVHYSR